MGFKILIAVIVEKKVALFTQGFYGIDAIKQLFKADYLPQDLIIVTDNDNFSNKPLLTFLQYFKIEYLISKNKLQIFDFLSDYEIDYIISIANRIILTKDIISKANNVAINLHPGILPAYKGCFSTPWSIINNEKFVGYSYHLLDEQIDSGGIIYIKKFIINKSDNAFNLNFKIMSHALSKLTYIISNYKTCNLLFNSSELGVYYKNEFPFNGFIQENWKIKQIERFFRASFFPPFLGAKAMVNGEIKYFATFNEYINFKKGE